MKIDIEKLLENQKISQLKELKEILWLNDNLKCFDDVRDKQEIGIGNILETEFRLERYASLIREVFPETLKSHGIIESELRDIPNMKNALEEAYNINIPGRLMLKMDSHLPIAGSIKARGGMFEVLRYAEQLAMKNGLINDEDDYAILASDEAKDFFSKYTIQVGSTGNLGMSIGIISAKLGFNVVVHMSKDAKQWKKDKLRENGVIVKEYESDYSTAVENGRNESDNNSFSYFVDDENSANLFLGYSVAAIRLRQQLDDKGIIIDKNHPLFVFLPCGIGGAPGGITFGLKYMFGDDVHCFFTEPTHAPCMLLGLATGLHDKISVMDLGIDGKTHADGLAVGRPSKFVGKYMENILSGIYTIDDNKLYDLLRLLDKSEGIRIEPSACASFAGFINTDSSDFNKYIEEHDLKDVLKDSICIAWATGGSMVPENIMESYISYNKN